MTPAARFRIAGLGARLMQPPPGPPDARGGGDDTPPPDPPWWPEFERRMRAHMQDAVHLRRTG